MIMNCRKCKSLTSEYVNTASGLDLHRFHWLKGDHEIGSIKGDCWNRLIEVTDPSYKINSEIGFIEPKLVHWTLGGPWFKDSRNAGGYLATEWFEAREQSMKLWD